MDPPSLEKLFDYLSICHRSINEGWLQSFYLNAKQCLIFCYDLIFRNMTINEGWLQLFYLNAKKCLIVCYYLIFRNMSINEGWLQHFHLNAKKCLIDCHYLIFRNMSINEGWFQSSHWNAKTCLIVVCYVAKFLPNTNHAILCDTVSLLCSKLPEDLRSLIMKDNYREISDIFVKSFMPHVKIFFMVPKLPLLPDADRSLKRNEILAGFMNFLLQVLNSEVLLSSKKEKRYSPLQKQLTFLLTFLGDTPFMYCEREEVDNLLAEYEKSVNEVGIFIYSFVFPTRAIWIGTFKARTCSLLRNIDLLITRIKIHCVEFSDPFPICVTSRPDVIDSFFIVDSLLEDFENLNSTISGMMTDEIKILHGKFRLCRCFIKDTKVPQEMMIRIRDMAYEVEYLVNSFTAGNIPDWYLNLRLPALINKIEIIVERTQEITNIAGIKVLHVAKGFRGEVSLKQTGTPSSVVDGLVVGYEEKRTEILTYIIQGSKTQQVISIYGMPGLGKTSIANKLYNDRSICDTFDRRVWCVVSQTYQKRKVLIDIFMSLVSNPDKDKISKMEDHDLGLEIYQILKGRKYLIVMDDVWESNTLDDLRRYFPDDGNGGRIMLTSRIEDIAPVNSIMYPLSLLSAVQCWDLLEKKVFPNQQCPKELVQLGKNIATKCKGLPLSVVVIAGVLSNVGKDKSIWEKVENNLGSYMFNDPTSCKKILELNYEHLPDHLKPCFLYFGAFREDVEVPVRNLIWLWIAEGFIQKEDDKSLEDVAEEHIFNLINRSLLLISKRRSDGGIKACRIHDVLHDMCQRKAHEINFIKSIKDRQPSIYEKYYRLFLHSGSWIDSIRRPFSLYCRSLICHVPDKLLCTPQMPLVRIMDATPTKYFLPIDKMKHLPLPVHLRYLVVSIMPEATIGNLVNLEILCVDSYSTTITIPSALLKLVKLRHVKIRISATFGKDCDTSQTNKLQSLSNVEINNHNHEMILRCSPHIRKLKCLCTSTEVPHFQFFTELESLSLEMFDRSYNMSSQSTNTSSQFTNTTFPLTIKKLNLSGACLTLAMMSIVGGLPNLHVLKLHYLVFGEEEWNTTVGEFQELRFLKIQCSGLKQWTAEIEHFPRLEHLVLSCCERLHNIPNELGNIPTLHTIEVIHSSYKANITAVQIEADQLEYGNEDLKVIITNDKWSKEQLIHDYKASRTSD